MTAKITYLACPYSHESLAVRTWRFSMVTLAAASLIEKGMVVFSPITMTHPIDRALCQDNASMGTDYWVSFDEAFMAACSEIVVLKLDGWEESSGVQREITYFRDRKLPVRFLDPSDVPVPAHLKTLSQKMLAMAISGIENHGS